MAAAEDFGIRNDITSSIAYVYDLFDIIMKYPCVS